MKRLALLVLLVAAPAQAGSTWSSDDTETAARADDYARAMSDGDEAALLATSESISPSRQKKFVMQAVKDYERAAKARPDLAEPHWRAANVLYGFFIDCDPTALCLPPDSVDPALFHRVIAHWDAAEQIDPLDPRLHGNRLDAGMLFHRAILRTKLGTDEDITGAIKDYQEWLDQGDPADPEHSIVVGNLAESYMMIGDLEHAIPEYQDALKETAETSLYYGLAVAYDRDGQGAKARDIVRALGEEQFQEWFMKVQLRETFYVPDGEQFYYLALASESLGHTDEAMVFWRRFIDSGAHPIFDDRARENLTALANAQAKKAQKPKAK
jgi:tetratricopeptide (TPR) repeat protein